MEMWPRNKDQTFALLCPNNTTYKDQVTIIGLKIKKLFSVVYISSMWWWCYCQ